MVEITPSIPTIGKVEMFLKDVFKLPRLIGTFPIDNDYYSISKSNLAKGVVLYFSCCALALIGAVKYISNEHLFSQKYTYVQRTVPAMIFYWIHLSWIIRNRKLLQEVYDDLKDIEYCLWTNGVRWNYKSTWSTKYLSLTAMYISGFLWDVLDEFRLFVDIPYYFIYGALMNIVIQYAILVQLLRSALRCVRSLRGSSTVVVLTDKLLDLCQKMNQLYEPQLFFYIVVVYKLILSSVYIQIVVGETLAEVCIVWLMSFMFPLVQTIMNIGEFSQEVLALQNSKKNSR